MVGEGEDTAYLQILRLLQAGADQSSAYALLMAALGHGQRPYFGQILPADVQGADTMHAAARVIDNKIAQLVIEGADRASQQQPFAREVLLFFDKHYPRGSDGKLRLEPPAK